MWESYLINRKHKIQVLVYHHMFVSCFTDMFKHTPLTTCHKIYFHSKPQLLGVQVAAWINALGFAGTLTIVSTQFVDNSKIASSLQASPIIAPVVVSCSFSNVICIVAVHDCVFDNNQGGLHVSSGGTVSYKSLVVTSCVFTNNWSIFSGGAIYISSINYVEISNCTFQANHAWLGYGGAIWGEESSVSVQVRHPMQHLGCWLHMI